MRRGFYDDPRVAAEYDATLAGSPAMNEDVPFYTELALQAHAAGLTVLELACGTGRVAIPIARAGVRVVGLDRSPAMLAVARSKAAGLANLTLVEGDMAGFDLGQRFGLIYVPARSFLLLTTVAEQLSCLTAVRRHLAPGGRFALNFFQPSVVPIAEGLTTRRRGPRRTEPDGRSAEGRRLVRWTDSRYDTAEQLIDEDRLPEELSDDGAVISRVYRNLRLRYVFRYEMEHLLVRSGFDVEALYGWFDKRPFDRDSAEMVWVARPA
jgi:SAM-dependent methyltransferase